MPKTSTTNEKTYDVSFKKISTISICNFHFLPNYNRQIIFEKTDVIGASKLPNNFYSAYGNVRLYPQNQTIWKQVAHVYGFDENTYKEEVANIMFKTAISNVSMTISQGFHSKPNGYEWVIKSFSATLNV